MTSTPGLAVRRPGDPVLYRGSWLDPVAGRRVPRDVGRHPPRLARERHARRPAPAPAARRLHGRHHLARGSHPARLARDRRHRRGGGGLRVHDGRAPAWGAVWPRIQDAAPGLTSWSGSFSSPTRSTTQACSPSYETGRRYRIRACVARCGSRVTAPSVSPTVPSCWAPTTSHGKPPSRRSPGRHDRPGREHLRRARRPRARGVRRSPGRRRPWRTGRDARGHAGDVRPGPPPSSRAGS